MKAVSIVIPPDKSISHRAVMLASISESTTCIKNLLMAEDIKRTIEAFRAMGVRVDIQRRRLKPATPYMNGVAQFIARSCADVRVQGVGMWGLKKPNRQIYLGNSGTTMRILPGILAGQDFEVVLTGDKSLSKRPMMRIAEPLRKMGAKILPLTPALSHKWERENKDWRGKGEWEMYPPLKIKGGKLKAIKYKSKIASAQVKSCILLAGLYADGVTSVSEPEKSRDHTERMLKIFGCRVESNRRPGLNLAYGIVRKARHCCGGGESRTVSLKGPVKLKSPGAIEIPGDISSAAFFIVAGCILPDIKIIIKNVGLNPTRIGILDILKRMRADIKLTNMSLRGGAKLRRSNLKEKDCFAEFTLSEANVLAMTKSAYESAGDIIVGSSKLKGVNISPKEVIRAIDEIPVIMVAACFAKGRTIIKGIEELRVKETDRIKSMVTNLRKIGADIIPLTLPSPHRGEGKGEGKECIVINGGKPLHGARVSSFGDHRTAMSMLVAGLATKGKVVVTGLGCINKSFPGFENLLRRLKPATPLMME